MASYSNIKYQTNIPTSNDLQNILGVAENPNFRYSSNNVVSFGRLPNILSNNLQIVDNTFIEQYNNISKINLETNYYVDIVFDEPTLVCGSIVIGFNFITNYIDLLGLSDKELSDTNVIHYMGHKDLFPQIKLKYAVDSVSDFMDLINGNILDENQYKRSLETLLVDNRLLYDTNKQIRESLSVAIPNNTVPMPTMAGIGSYFNKEKNIVTYLNPIGIFRESTLDSDTGEYTEKKIAVVDSNPIIDNTNSRLFSIYQQRDVIKEAISNYLITIPEPLMVQKLRLNVTSPFNFICNISAFYIDEKIYVPPVYDTTTGIIELKEQVNTESNPFTLGNDPKILSSTDETKLFSAKLIWEGQIYGNIDDSLVYSLNKNINTDIDLSEAFIVGNDFQKGKINTWIIDGSEITLQSLTDSSCDAGEDTDNLKVMYVHNIKIPSSIISNNILGSIRLGVNIYSLNDIQSDFIKTITFDTSEYRFTQYSQSIAYDFVESFNELTNDINKLYLQDILGTYVYPRTNNELITIDTGKIGSISSDRILYSQQIVRLKPEIADIFDIELDLPKYTSEGSPLILIPTNNFCQIGLDSNRYFDSINWKILFSEQESVNKFEDGSTVVLVFMANGLSSYKDTIIMHSITTIISEG